MRFPPESTKEWIAWFFYPRFPRRVLTVYDREGNTDATCYDEEIENLARTKNLTVIRCTYISETTGEGITRTYGTFGADPFQYADNVSPSQVFGVYTTKWTMMMGFFVYSVFLFGVFLGFLEQIWWLMPTLLIYLFAQVQRFGVPSIRFLEMHVVGSIGGLPFVIPGPVAQSVLSMSQILRLLGQSLPEIKGGCRENEKDCGKVVEELVKEIEVQKEINKRLYGMIIRIERQSDRIYDVAHKVAESLSHDLIEEMREKYEQLLSRRTRMYILLMLVTLVVGLLIGFLFGSVWSVGVTPP